MATIIDEARADIVAKIARSETELGQLRRALAIFESNGAGAISEPAAISAPAHSRAPRRPHGSTRRDVLAALTDASPEPLTASQVAERVGLPAPTVSTTLSKLAKSGEIAKAGRGYQAPVEPAAEPSA